MDKERLFQRRATTLSGFPEDDVEIPGIGTVRVRGLSRNEGLETGEITNTKERAAHIIAIAMLDPVLSVDEVKRWAAVATAAELEPVDTRIAQLSGMLPDSAKAAYKSDGDGSDDRIRSLPGAEIGDDGSPDAGGAV